MNEVQATTVVAPEHAAITADLDTNKAAQETQTKFFQTEEDIGTEEEKIN